MLFLCSCSEVTDTTAKELRSNSWILEDNSNYQLSLDFKDDDAIMKITDKTGKTKAVFTGTTIVTADTMEISDKETLSKYNFTYKLQGDNVKLSYKGKTLKLKKLKE
jgi:hypothetical protein